MNAMIEKMLARSSIPSCSDEDVSMELIEQLLACAMSANDHGRLAPWRFLVYKGNGRSILADAFANHERQNGTLSLELKAKLLPFRAPVVICVVAEPRDCKIPRRDQLFSAAAACQLITLAASAVGLASFWRTGKFAESDLVNRELGLAHHEEIVGFIYVGYSIEASQSIRAPRENKVFIYG